MIAVCARHYNKYVSFNPYNSATREVLFQFSGEESEAGIGQAWGAGLHGDSPKHFLVPQAPQTYLT